MLTPYFPSGTGSSAIYPLLACATRPKWRMLATDIDDKNLEYAERNIERNNLAKRIKLLPRKAEQPLIPLDELGIEKYVFGCCLVPLISPLINSYPSYPIVLPIAVCYLYHGVVSHTHTHTHTHTHPSPTPSPFCF